MLKKRRFIKNTFYNNLKQEVIIINFLNYYNENNTKLNIKNIEKVKIRRM